MEEELHIASRIGLSLIIVLAFLLLLYSIITLPQEVLTDGVDTLSTSRGNTGNLSSGQNSPELPQVPQVPIVEDSSSSSLIWVFPLFILVFSVFVLMHLADLDIRGWFTSILRVNRGTRRFNDDYRTPPKTKNEFGMFLERGSADFVKQE